MPPSHCKEHQYSWGAIAQVTVSNFFPNLVADIAEEVATGLVVFLVVVVCLSLALWLERGVP